MGNSIYHSNAVYKSMLELGLPGHFRRVVLTHIMAILISVFVRGYRGKTVQVSASSPRHRTAVAHFLNAGKWDDAELERLYKEAVIRRIWAESKKSGQPIGCIADDTIASKTKPSSQASRPIEAADFHYSHLKRKQDYGHQVVEILLTCNGLTLSYASVLYDKARSKIAITREIAEELPFPPGKGYFLCDCWYSCKELTDAFAAKGFQTVCALKSNRVIYPYDVKQSVSQFAATLCAEDSGGRRPRDRWRTNVLRVPRYGSTERFGRARRRVLLSGKRLWRPFRFAGLSFHGLFSFHAGDSQSLRAQMAR